MKDGSVEELPLDQVVNGHFLEFRSWCYQQQYTPKKTTKFKQAHPLLVSLVNGYLDNKDLIPALDMLGAPNLVGQVLPQYHTPKGDVFLSMLERSLSKCCFFFGQMPMN
jgi:hypothetical protein